MAIKFLNKFSVPKLVGRYGVLIIDTFSTLVFFMLLGASWVLATTGSIFALVKVWHWQESWKTTDRLRRYLHRSTWLILAMLSIYFLITLGLSITQPPEEIQVNENAVALEEAVAISRVANIQSLIREQEMLLMQNNSLAERMITLNQWSDAFRPLQAQMNANLERLGVIAEQLNKIHAEQTAEVKAQTAIDNTESNKIIKFQPVKPIGAPSLMGRVMPPNWVNLSIILLFTLIGIALEITVALSSLPAESMEKKEIALDKTTDEEDTKKEYHTSVGIINIPEHSDQQLKDIGASLDKTIDSATKKDNEKLEDASTLIQTKNTPKGLTKPERKGYEIKEIQKYIDVACQDDGVFMPDNHATEKGLTLADCSGIRKYIKSLKLKGEPVIELVANGVYKSKRSKEKLKKFIALQAGE